jgi:hypothetical protein
VGALLLKRQPEYKRCPVAATNKQGLDMNASKPG